MICFVKKYLYRLICWLLSLAFNRPSWWSSSCGLEIGLEVGEGATALRSRSPSSISPCFGELELFLLELGSPGSWTDISWSGFTVWWDGLRAGTEEGDDIPQMK